jgi:hypothetical protein
MEMRIESRLYHYGLGLGVPFRALNSVANAFDVARHASENNARRRVARQVLAGSPWVGFIPKDRGFALTDPSMLPGAQEALDAARTIIETAPKEGYKIRKSNPFFELETPQFLRDYPALMKFALSDAVLQIVTDYFGLVPQMKELGIWVTPPQDHQFSSQLYHLDKPEGRLLKLFMNISRTDEDAGALTFLPADVSEKVRRKTNYEAVYYRGDGRLDDKAVFLHCSRDDQMVLTGDVGKGGFVDTSNCFHFGSRCKAGERRVLTLSYMLPHKARKRRTPLFDLVPKPVDELRQLVLSGAEFR